MKLKTELDLIYDQVYMIKESMSAGDSAAFIAGFEEGIDEGIGKWLGKATGWLSDVPSKIKKGAGAIGDKARELYGKGKEFATKAVEKIKEFAKRAIDGLKEKMSQAGQWISEKFESFVAKMREAFDTLGKKLAELWEATKDKSAKFWEATKGLFDKMVEAIKKGYHSTKDGLANMGGRISDWVSENWEKLKSAGTGAKDRLTLIYNRALDALRRGGGAAGKWLGAVALFLTTKFASVKEWLAKIPALMNRFYTMLKDFTNKQIMDFKIGFEETSGRPFNRAKGFIEDKPVYPDVNPAALRSEEDGKRHLASDSETVDPSRPHVITPFGGVEESSPLKSRGYSIAEVKDAARALASDSVFAGKFAKYSERDLKSILRREKFTDTAIGFIIDFYFKGKSKQRRVMPLADSFRYLMTFESFKCQK